MSAYHTNFLEGGAGYELDDRGSAEAAMDLSAEAEQAAADAEVLAEALAELQRLPRIPRKGVSHKVGQILPVRTQWVEECYESSRSLRRQRQRQRRKPITRE